MAAAPQIFDPAAEAPAGRWGNDRDRLRIAGAHDCHLPPPAGQLSEIRLARIAGRRGRRNPAEDLQAIAGMNAEQISFDEHKCIAGGQSPLVADANSSDANYQSRPIIRLGRAQWIVRRRNPPRTGRCDGFNTNGRRRLTGESADLIDVEEVPIAMMPAAADRDQYANKCRGGEAIAIEFPSNEPTDSNRDAGEKPTCERKPEFTISHNPCANARQNDDQRLIGHRSVRGSGFRGFCCGTSSNRAIFATDFVHRAQTPPALRIAGQWRTASVVVQHWPTSLRCAGQCHPPLCHSAKLLRESRMAKS
jgi:hypothetical protein